jgi:hypothetical protein
LLGHLKDLFDRFELKPPKELHAGKIIVRIIATMTRKCTCSGYQLRCFFVPCTDVIISDAIISDVKHHHCPHHQRYLREHALGTLWVVGLQNHTNIARLPKATKNDK